MKLTALKKTRMNKEQITTTLKNILSINSPSGYTIEINNYLEELFNQNGIPFTKTNKGSLLVSFSDEPRLVLTAHVDTLGGMVKEVKSDGKIEITSIGGLQLNAIESEYVTIRNSEGKLFRGTFLMNDPATHVNKDIGSQKRDASNMAIRLDAEAVDMEAVSKLGIDVGDYVFIDTRFEALENGFIKSRFLDDKACAAILLELIFNLKDKLKDSPIAFYFSNYEEVGHGSCIGIPASAEELLVLDMAVVGTGCKGDETKVSICAKDSTGPYDFEMTNKLRSLAKKNKMDYVIDIYPYYGSDGSAALSSGYDVRVGLIGPGVSASHGMERTHIKGLENTYNLTLAYIEDFLKESK